MFIMKSVVISFKNRKMENRVGEVENCFPLYTYLNELNIENNCRCVLVRVLLTWEARNFKRNKDLMSVDFLLLDEKAVGWFLSASFWTGYCGLLFSGFWPDFLAV
ncbi:hypothetical protein ACS0TY_024522 [Phlomoides rotata]